MLWITLDSIVSEKSQTKLIACVELRFDPASIIPLAGLCFVLSGYSLLLLSRSDVYPLGAALPTGGNKFPHPSETHKNYF